jgi:DNA-binding FadR family transcriptional regulator
LVNAQADAEDTTAFLDADLGFHEALAEACGNPFLQLVCQPINMFLRSHYSHRDLYPSSPEETLGEHEEILRSIAAGDTFHAHQAMQEHLRRLVRKAPAMPLPTDTSVPSGEFST